LIALVVPAEAGPITTDGHSAGNGPTKTFDTTQSIRDTDYGPLFSQGRPAEGFSIQFQAANSVIANASKAIQKSRRKGSLDCFVALLLA
jgi:hypothetical protein